jgi:hypothetical protein
VTESAPSSIGLFARSLLWTILFPGFFAGYVPWRYFGPDGVELDHLRATDALGLIGIGLGASPACASEAPPSSSRRAR